MFFFINHRLSAHVMADIRHDFYFYPLCNRCHTQAQEIKTKAVSNDVRLRRI